VKNPPVYIFKAPRPAAMFRPVPRCFAHALDAWDAAGFLPIVQHVEGNGTLCDQGTDGVALVVWPPGGECPPLTFGPETHERVQVDPDCAVAWRKDSKPTPDDMDNGNPLDLRCEPLELADGNVWQIPQLRDPAGPLLPRDIVRDRITRQIAMPVKTEFAELWDDTAGWFDRYWLAATEGRATFSMHELVDFATRVIGLRYHFADATQTALRVLDSSNLQAIVRVAIGWQHVMDTLEAWPNNTKKKGPEQ
jgi:hypothetical protein